METAMNGIELAESAMVNDMQRLQVISHNLANIATTGYRRDTAVTVPRDARPFEVATDPIGAPEALVAAVEAWTVHEQGALSFTGNPLDVAIEGDAFLAVETPDGEGYSRNGALRLDPAGQLVTAAGWPVLTLEGPLRLETPAPRIDREGRIWNGEDFLGQLKLVRFSEPGDFRKQPGGYFIGSGGEVPPAAEDAADAQLRQGYLENSNVEAAEQMVALLQVMRHFEAAQRVIRSYDEIMETAVSTLADF
jgi:flagellar basal-body rod protein FlgG